MDWLSQNWIWILLLVGGYFLMMRMGGCGMGHAMGRRHGNDASPEHNARDRGVPMHVGADTLQLEAPEPESVVDPVSKQAVPANALSCLYQGHAYFFESRENRDAFESDPGKYISASQMTGPVPMPSKPAPQHPHRSHGCC